MLPFPPKMLAVHTPTKALADKQRLLKISNKGAPLNFSESLFYRIGALVEKAQAPVDVRQVTLNGRTASR